eukprot:gene9581-10568_t
MDDEVISKEEKEIIKHGWLEKAPKKTGKLQKWKRKYFVFCKITSEVQSFLELHCYKDFAAYKHREMPEKKIDVTQASEICIGPEKMNGYKHIIKVTIPGRIHFLSASSCSEMFAWNGVLRSKKYDDLSRMPLLEQPPVILPRPHKYKRDPQKKPEWARERPVTEYYECVYVLPPRTYTEIQQSTRKIRKQLGYCPDCSKENTLAAAPAYQNMEMWDKPDKNDQEDLYETVEELYDELSNVEIYDQPSTVNSYDEPERDESIHKPAIPNRGVEHEEDDSKAVENAYTMLNPSKSVNDLLGATRQRNPNEKRINYSTVSLPALYISHKNKGAQLDNCHQASSGSNPTPRGNPGQRVIQKTPLSKTTSAPPMPKIYGTVVDDDEIYGTAVDDDDDDDEPRDHDEDASITDDDSRITNCIQESEDDRTLKEDALSDHPSTTTTTATTKFNDNDALPTKKSHHHDNNDEVSMEKRCLSSEIEVAAKSVAPQTSVLEGESSSKAKEGESSSKAKEGESVQECESSSKAKEGESSSKAKEGESVQECESSSKAKEGESGPKAKEGESVQESESSSKAKEGESSSKAKEGESGPKAKELSQTTIQSEQQNTPVTSNNNNRSVVNNNNSYKKLLKNTEDLVISHV